MTTAFSESPFMPTLGGPKVILLDLQGTLATPPSNNPKVENIRNNENYHDWLIAGLKELRKFGWEIHMFTVRKVDLREATLNSIRKKTGWQPDKEWFNDLRISEAPRVKSILLDRLIEECRPSVLYAFESNGESRKMFKRRDVRCRRINSPKALEKALCEIEQM